MEITKKMSLERAGLNCERCYTETLRENGRRNERELITVLTYPYRNATMLALEGIFAETAYLENGERKKMCDKVRQALGLCYNCDFKEPRVMDLVNKLREVKVGD